MAAKSPIENLTAAQQVQFFYVTFYGRPADPAGLAFWTDAVTKNGILNVVKDFGNSVESASLYGSLTTREKIAKMYLTTFGREADSGGLDYWTGLVTNGTIPNFAQAVVHMYNAMAPVDQTAVQNRQTVADEFTTLIASSPLLKAAFTDPATSGKAGQTLATWMASVSADPSSVTAAQANTTSVITNIALGNANKASPAFGSPVLPTITEDGGMVSGKVIATDADNIPTVTQKLAYELVGSASSKGNAVSINAATGDFTYTPAANFNGADSFTVAVSDGAGGRTVKTIDLNVVAVNDAPKIAADSVSTALATTEDVAKTGSITATDVDRDNLTYAVATQGGKGTVVIDAATGKYTYTPAADKNGTDSFVLTVSDGKAADSITVNVTIAAVNDAPKLTADSVSTALSTNEDVAKSGSIAATDVDGDTVTYAVATQGTKGSVVIDAATGKYTYTPAADKNGADSFVLTASDGKAADSITVNVAIAAVNDAPKIAADSVSTSLSTSEDVAKAGSITASDVDGDKLTYAVASQGSIGSVSIDAATGKYTYTPSANKNGVDSFVLTASDGNGGADSITVNVTVAAVNDAPKIADSVATSLSTSEDVTKAGSITATDIEGDTITYAVGSQGKIGTVSVDASTGVYTYAPVADKNGTDSFVLTASDGKGGADSITVNVTVAAVNDAPKITADSVSTALATTEDTAKAGSIKATDVDGDSLTYAVASQGKLGTVSIDSATGSYTYTPKANENGSDSFVLSASDGKGGADSITVNVTIAAVNDPPIAGALSLTTVVGGSSVSISPLTAASDIDGDTLSILSATATRGSVSVANGVITYTAQSGQGSATGVSDTITYVISDGNANNGTVSGSAAVSIVTKTIGGPTSESLGGSPVAETFFGDAGDDFIDGGGGADEIYGGDGNDTVVFNSAATVINGGDGSDWLRLPLGGTNLKFDLSADNQLSSGSISPVIQAFEHIDGSRTQVSVSIVGSSGANYLYGGAAADSIVGKGGADYISGGKGNDTLIGDSGADTIFGGDGADTISAGAGANLVYGNDGDDSITAAGTGTIYGGDGNDLILSTATKGAVYGDGGDDSIDASGAASISIYGGTGADSIYAINNNSNYIEASDGDDIVRADVADIIALGEGANSLFGQASDSLTVTTGDGNNYISINGLYDQITTGAGSDTVFLSSAVDSTVTINAGLGSDVLVLAGSDTATSSDLRYVSNVEVIDLTSSSAVVMDLRGDSAFNAQTFKVDGDSIYFDKNFAGTGSVRVELSQIGSDSVARITADSASDLVIIANGGLGSEDIIAASADGGLTSDVIQATLSANASFNLTNVTGIDSLNIGRSGGTGRVTASVTTGTDPIAVSLTSTASADSLSANVTAGGAVTVSAGAGNDVVAVASNVKSLLILGEGDNLVTGGSGDTLTVTFGAGADSLLQFNAMYDDVIMGAGNDFVQATGTSLSGVTVSGGSGRDTIEITGDSVIVNADLAYVTDFEVIRVNTSAAGDSIMLDGDSIAMDSVATGFYLTGSDTIRLEDFAVSPSIYLTGTTGSTVVLVTADSDMNVSVYADSLNSTDSIQAAGANDQFISTTNLTSTYNFTGSTSVEYITLTAGDSVNATTSVVMGTGQSLILNAGVADSVSLRVDFVGSSTSGTVKGGESADVVILSNTSKASVSVFGGADSIYADGSDTLSINAGDGADTVSIDGAYDVVDLGNGNDLLVLSSASLSTLVAEGGAGGQDTIRLANSSAATMAASVLGGVTGFEVLDLSANGKADSVTVVGTQFSTVVVGDDDWVTFIAAGTVPLSASSSAGRVVSSDSVTSMTLTADSLSGAAVAATDTLSLAGPADVLNITGTGATTFDGSNVSGLELINVSSRSARTVNFSNIEVALTINAIAAGDTLTSLVVGINADAADTSPQTIVVNASTGAGADSIYVASGDTLSSLNVNLGLGSDTVIAGIGDDVILVSATGATSADSNYVSAGAGNDSIETGNGNDTIITGSGNDTAIAGAGSDSVFAGASGATVGTSYINLGSGNDTLTANADTLGDFVTLGGGMDSVVLGSGSDWVIVGSAGDTDGVYLDLGGGANYASLESGADTVIGGSGADTVLGGDGANVIALAGGNDSYTGGVGADSVSSGTGNDTVSLLAGNDTAFGEAGNDLITSGDGADYVDGGDGNDTIDLRALTSTAADSNTGIGGAGDDSIVGGFGKNSLLGGTGADIIIGGDDADSILPGEDWDTVTAGGGNDTVVFLSGNELTSSATGRTDIVDGGSGLDYLKLVASSTGDTYTPQSLGAVTNFEAVIVDDSSATDLNTVKLDTYLLLTGTSGLASPRYDVEFTGQQLAYLDLSGVGVQASTVALDVTLGSSIAGATVSDVGNNAVKVTVTAGDSISSDLMFLGGSDDTLSLTGFTMSSGAFDADSVSAGTLLIAGDSTKTYAVTWANSFNTQDMVISVTGAGADSTAFVWNSDGADSVGITLVGHLTAGDTITTGDDNDSIVARGGLNSITSGAGNDFISGGDSVDVISFGAGQKSVYSFGGSDIITSSGADTAAVFIWLGDGGDSVSATSKTGIVTIDLGTGADTVRTGSGADVIFAQVGDTDGDVVASGAGNDSVVLLSGNDDVDLGVGRDTLNAGNGNDVVVVTGDSLGRDWIELGAGNDIFTNAAESTSGSYIDLGTGLDTVFIGGSGMSTGGDSIFATASDTMADVVSTGGGADYISLGDGADSIMSGSGNDTIYAGGGADSVYPGEGVDLVYLGTDTVTDYLFMANSITGGYESSRLAMDTVYNFDWDTDGAGTVDAIYDLIKFTGSFGGAAVDVGAADFITDGVVNPLIIQGAANGVTALNSILVESGNSTNKLTIGEVFAFEVAGSTYVAVANGTNTVGTVIQLVGVTGVVKLSEVGSTDAFYLLGPTGG